MNASAIFLLTLVVKGTVLLLIGLAAARVLEGAHAELRRRVWLTTLAGLLLLPVFAVALPGWEIVPVPGASGDGTHGSASASAMGAEIRSEDRELLAPLVVPPAPGALEEEPAAVETAGSPSAEDALSPAVALLLGGWIVGGALVLGRMGWGLVVLRRIRSRGRRVRDPALLQALEDMAHRAGVDPRRIQLVVSDEMGVPATWGVRRPVVLLPSRIARAPGRLCDTVLLHELLHVRRGAWLGQLLALAACAVHWFNPLAWRVRRELVRAEEAAVDQAIVRSGVRPALYGQYLLAVARSLHAESPRGPVALAMAEESSLHQRLRALLDPARAPAPPTPTVAWGVTVALLLGIGGTASLDARPPGPPTPQEPVAISPAPILEVGVAEGVPEEELHRVVTPFRLPDDRLAVPMGDALEVRVFDPDGAFLERLGRSGDGPGELRGLSAAWARGDTIEIMDGRLRRITRFLPGGTVETLRLAEAPGVQGSVPEPLSDGWVTTGVAGVSIGGRDEVVVHRFGGDGTHRAEVARVPGMERVRYPNGGTGPAALSPRAQIEVRDDRIYVAETLTPEIRIFDREGTLERTITWEPDPPARPAEALAGVRARAAATLDEVPLATAEQALSLSAPDRISAFWTFLVDPAGYIWIRSYDPIEHAAALGGFGSGDYLRGGSGPGGLWRVLDPEGTEVGTIQVPEGLELLRVDAEVVLGLHRDPLGVESVRVHPLERR